MHNCYKLFANGYLFGIFHTEAHAEHVKDLFLEKYPVIVLRIEPAFIEGVGF